MKRLNLCLGLALLAGFVLSVLTGSGAISSLEQIADADVSAFLSALQARLPRGVLAVVVGAGLGGSGAVMQAYLRHPLAGPGLFGIGPGAALGAVFSLWLAGCGLVLPRWGLLVFTLSGAGGAMALLAMLAGRGICVAGFKLGSMMVAALAGAVVSLLVSLSPLALDLSDLVSWTTGAMTDRSWGDVAIALVLTVLGLGTLALAGRGLDAMSLGEVTARSLGVSPGALAWLVIVGVGLCVGAGVAAAGVIGFVGLIVPHVMRPLTDRRPSSLLLPSALGGGLLLVLADSLCRILPLAGRELRLGLAFSLLGVPFFLWLLVMLRRRGRALWGGWA